MKRKPFRFSWLFAVFFFIAIHPSLFSQTTTLPILTDYLRKVSHVQSIETFYTLPAGVDPNSLSDIQKIKFRRQKERKQTNTYLSGSGEFYTEITYLSSEKVRPDWMRPIDKVIIDKNATTVIALNGDTLSQVVHSNKYNSNKLVLGNVISSNVSTFGKFPFESPLTASQVTNLQDKGYNVTIMSGNKFSLEMGGDNYNN